MSGPSTKMDEFFQLLRKVSLSLVASSELSRVAQSVLRVSPLRMPRCCLGSLERITGPIHTESVILRLLIT